MFVAGDIISKAYIVVKKAYFISSVIFEAILSLFNLCNMARAFTCRLGYQIAFFCCCLVLSFGFQREFSRINETPNTLAQKSTTELMRYLLLSRNVHKVNVPGRNTALLSWSEWQRNVGTDISARYFLQDSFKEAVPFATQRTRNRRQINAFPASKIDPIACANHTFTVRIEDEYGVWKNFVLIFRGRRYHYDEYRVTDDGVQICSSAEHRVQRKWRRLIYLEKRVMPFRRCPVSIDGFFRRNYTLYKNFTVALHLTRQTFTRKDYGVIFGRFAICSANLSSSCNDNLMNVNHGEPCKVWKNFSLSYQGKVYDYREYRFRSGHPELCVSSDPKVQAVWRTRNSWEKFLNRYKCHKYAYALRAFHYVLSEKFLLYFAQNGQFFTWNDYAVIHGKPVICEEKFTPSTTEYTEEDLLTCKNSILSLKYDDDYKVCKNFSIVHENQLYDYTEYRVLNNSIKICYSTDTFMRRIWKLRNFWVKEQKHFNSCDKPVNVVYTTFSRGKYSVLKDLRILILPTKQIITEDDYGLYQNKLIVCREKLKPNFVIQLHQAEVAPLCALGLSILSLLLLLIVYGMLPELRALPGLNLMSLSFACLLWQTYYVVYLSLYRRVGEIKKIPCSELQVTRVFVIYSTFTNAAVNVYHLRETFCCNTLVKSDGTKFKTFLRYSVFSWGVPVVVTIVYILLVKNDVLRFYQHLGDCVSGHDIPEWADVLVRYGLLSVLLLYIVAVFSLTAYRIRQKLKASDNIAQKSNIVKNRKSFVLLLKLLTTTALSWSPLLIINYVENRLLFIGLSTLTLLSGVYVAVAFVFTRKNYHLLKKRYFLAKRN